MSRRRLFSSLLMLALLSLASLAGAQSADGTIAGLVTDRYGTPLKKAVVRASNLDDGLTVESITDDNGTYRINQMTAGHYEITLSMGALGVLTKKVKLEAGQSISVNFVFNIEEPRGIDPNYRAPPPSMI